MLEYYVSQNGELMSGKEKDLILQTSKGVDKIVVHLPQDYNDDNIVASITFRNPKNVESNEYKMEHVEGSKELSYLLNHAWFSSVKGVMQFTVRVYSTDVNLDGSVSIDPETGDIVANLESKVQVFTKGSYQILEAVNRGVTPEIPQDDLEKLYLEIASRATKQEIYTYVNKVVGISKNQSDSTDYKNIDYRLRIVEEDLQDVSDIEEIVERIYLAKDKTIDVLESDKPLTIIRRNSIRGDVEVPIKLPVENVSVEINDETQVPTMTELVVQAEKAERDIKGNIIDETYIKINTFDTITGQKTFKNGLKTKGVYLTHSSQDDYDGNQYNIAISNNDPYAQIRISGVDNQNKSGNFSLSLTDGYIEHLSTGNSTLRFYLRDLVMKDTPVYKDIQVNVDGYVIKETIPYLYNGNITCIVNGELVIFHIVSTKDNIVYTQVYGETKTNVSISVNKIIRVGDLSE